MIADIDDEKLTSIRNVSHRRHLHKQTSNNSKNKKKSIAETSNDWNLTNRNSTQEFD